MLETVWVKFGLGKKEDMKRKKGTHEQKARQDKKEQNK